MARGGIPMQIGDLKEDIQAALQPSTVRIEAIVHQLGRIALALEKIAAAFAGTVVDPAEVAELKNQLAKSTAALEAAVAANQPPPTNP